MRLLVVLLAFLVSCVATPPIAHAPGPSAFTEAHWAPSSRPVSVLVPESHPCREAVILAAENWRAWGVNYLRVHVVSDQYASEVPDVGQISIRMEYPSTQPRIGETIVSNDGGELQWAAIRLRICATWVATHELGHALGLLDEHDASNIMNFSYEGNYGLRESQRKQVQ